MAMTILNNTASMMSLGELNKNITEVGKQLAKISSGKRVVGAGNGMASEYAISKKMQVQIRGLGQDVQNTKTGSSLLKVAAGGTERILEELRSLKELAINAANDHNTDLDRAVLQKEFDQRKVDIEDIATSTNYNGIPLLDGTWKHYKKVSYDEWQSGGGAGSSGTGETSMESIGVPEPYTPVSTGVLEPGDSPTLLDKNNHNITITSAGVYTIPSGYTGTITLASDVSGPVKGVKFVQANPSESLKDVHIIGPSEGGGNIWLENVNVDISSGNFIQFQGSDNVLSIKGTNSVTGSTNDAKIHIGGGLTVEGSGSLSGTATDGAFIGTNSGEKTNSSNVTINSGKYNVNTKPGSAGAGIGSGKSAKIGDITINGGTFVIKNNMCYAAAIGAGGDLTGQKYDYTTFAGDITINNAILDLSGFDAALGSGVNGSAENIMVNNSWIQTISKRGAGIGSGEWGIVKDITITSSCELHVNNPTDNWKTNKGDDAAPIGAGANADAGVVSVETELLPPVDPPLNSDIGDWITSTKSVLGNPLIIHTGTKANQNLRCYIEDMRLDALGLSKDMETGNEKVSILTQKAATQALGSMIPENWHNTDILYDMATPEQKADISNYMGPIDRAIEYVLDQSTQLGAYLSRLEFTEQNLVTAEENVTDSESTIADADMAQEMVKYTRANILQQASQAMLAQANQTSSSVLSLLQ